MRMDWGLNPCGTPWKSGWMWLDAIFNGDLNQESSEPSEPDRTIQSCSTVLWLTVLKGILRSNRIKMLR